MVAVQRASSDLKLNPHLHVVFLDGVYAAASDGSLEFRALPRLSTADVSDVLQNNAASGEEVPVILAFPDWEAQRDRCRVGCHFELREGNTVTGVGTVRSTATRPAS